MGRETRNRITNETKISLGPINWQSPTSSCNFTEAEKMGKGISVGRGGERRKREVIAHYRSLVVIRRWSTGFFSSTALAVVTRFCLICTMPKFKHFQFVGHYSNIQSLLSLLLLSCLGYYSFSLICIQPQFKHVQFESHLRSLEGQTLDSLLFLYSLGYLLLFEMQKAIV